MISRLGLTSLAASILFAISSTAPVKRWASGPHVDTDFADPAILTVGDTWYAFATQSSDYPDIHVQVASSKDFVSWSLLEGTDALPDLPSWVNASVPNVWAPDVVQVAENQFVLYISATTNTAGDGAYHCVGTATSSSVTGPYTPNNEPLICPIDQGGAIDASGFADADGSRYVLYKIDGNAKGHGGSCGNTVAPIVSTPIMIQQVAADDGVTKVGAAVQILANAAEDGPLVEAPSLIRLEGGAYALFYSSGCFVGSTYTAKYATSDSVTGPYVRAVNNPLLATGSFGLDGPGGLHAVVAADGFHVAFHALSAAGDGKRFLYTGMLAIDGTTISI